MERGSSCLGLPIITNQIKNNCVCIPLNPSLYKCYCIRIAIACDNSTHYRCPLSGNVHTKLQTLWRQSRLLWILPELHPRTTVMSVNCTLGESKITGSPLDFTRFLYHFCNVITLSYWTIIFSPHLRKSPERNKIAAVSFLLPEIDVVTALIDQIYLMQWPHLFMEVEWYSRNFISFWRFLISDK